MWYDNSFKLEANELSDEIGFRKDTDQLGITITENTCHVLQHLSGVAIQQS